MKEPHGLRRPPRTLEKLSGAFLVSTLAADLTAPPQAEAAEVVVQPERVATASVELAQQTSYQKTVEAFLNPERTVEPRSFQHEGIRFSSELDATDLKYSQRACSSAAVYMIMSFWQQRHPEVKGAVPYPTSLDDFIQQAVTANVRDEYGWTQAGFIQLAKSYGVDLRRQDFGDAEKPYAASLSSLLQDLANGPVVVSITQGKESHNLHTIVLSGFYVDKKGNRGFYVYDPIAPAIDKARKPTSPQKRYHRKGRYKTTDYPDFNLEKLWTGRWLSFTPPEVTK